MKRGFVPYSESPKQKKFVFDKNAKSDASAVEPTQKAENHEGRRQNVAKHLIGKSAEEKTYFLTGTVERVMKWHRLCPLIRCFFEVVATVVSMNESSVQGMKIFLLRDNKGPILQVHYYVDRGPRVHFTEGQLLKCTGLMIGDNILSAVCIRTASVQEASALPRHCYIGDHAISHLLNSDD